MKVPVLNLLSVAGMGKLIVPLMMEDPVIQEFLSNDSNEFDLVLFFLIVIFPTYLVIRCIVTKVSGQKEKKAQKKIEEEVDNVHSKIQ